MAKKVYKLNNYEGGINRSADPRDIKDNELEEAFNVNLSNTGRITTPGDTLSSWYTYNDHNYNYHTDSVGNSYGILQPMWLDDRDILTNDIGLTNGYGLFACSHDYTSNGMADADSGTYGSPQPEESEFVLINDGADIHLWDSCWNNNGAKGQSRWIYKAIKLGRVHLANTQDNDTENALFVDKVKPTYYKADNGIRVCDGNFNEIPFGSSNGAFLDNDDELELTNATGEYYGATFSDDDIGTFFRINDEIIEMVSKQDSTNATFKRGRFHTTPVTHDTLANIYRINVPKVLEHIKAPMLEKAYAYHTNSTTKTFTGTSTNVWNERIQSCEPPERAEALSSGAYGKGLIVYDGKVTAMARDGFSADGDNHAQEPNDKEKVLLSIYESNSAETEVVKCTSYAESTPVNGVSTVEITASLSSTTFAGLGYNIGKTIIISDSTNGAIDGLAEIVGYGSGTNKLKVLASIATDAVEDTDGDFTVRLEENRIDENLQNKYVFGMSYLYDGGGNNYQESPIQTGYMHSGIIPQASAAIDSVSDWFYRIDTTSLINTAVTETNVATDVNGWIKNEGGLRFVDSTNDQDTHLAYVSTGAITDGAEYKIAITVEGSGQLFMYPPGTDDTDGGSVSSGGWIGTTDTSNVSPIAINEPGTYLINTKAQTTNTNTAHVLVVAGDNDDGGGDIKITYAQVFAKDPVEMNANNAIDMRGWEGIPKLFSSFNMNNAAAYKWNPSIRGFKVYMKQVDSATAELSRDWLLVTHTDFKDGTFINYGNDELEKPLALYGGGGTVSNGWSETGANFINSLVATSITRASNAHATSVNGLSDYSTLRNIPLQTYDSENGYKSEITTSAMYKTATMINRKVFAGNLKIGDKTYPDRMIESPMDKFDVFPNDGLHFIDVAVSDGDAIVKLESVDDKLIQFKEHHAYVLKVDSEGVDLVNSWNGKGIKNPSQAIKAGDGVVWANNNGLFYYNGEKIMDVTLNKFSMSEWKINESAAKPALLAYDAASNKVIIQTSNHYAKNNGGYIYDLNSQSLVESQNIFVWYGQTGALAGNNQGGVAVDNGNGMSSNTDTEGAVEDEIDETVAIPSTFRTNFITTRNDFTMLATNTVENSVRAEFNRWDDRPKFLWNFTGSASKFKLQTKDIDFGNPSRRKKIYKVYVTFKSHGFVSGIRMLYATNGSNTFTGNTFQDTTYYTNLKGFDSWGDSVANTSTGVLSTDNTSTDWITVELKPSSRINNIYSMQLKFEYCDKGHSGYKYTDSPVTLGDVLDSNGADGEDRYQAFVSYLTDKPSASVSETDGYYNGMPLFVYDGQSYGANFRVIDYVASSRKVILDAPVDNHRKLITQPLVPTINDYYDLGHIPGKFEINDITIVYRDKSIK